MSRLSGFGPAPIGRLARLRRLLFGQPRPREPAPSRFRITPADKAEPRVHPRAGGASFSRMQMQLAASLHAVPGTRKSLRHLAHFERSLAVKGAGALDALSIDRLRRVHAELLILLSVAPSSAGLVALEQGMAESLAVRCARSEPDAGVQVSDGTLADFDQLVIDTDLAPLPDR